VHDSKVRRIAAITPDIIRPKPHVFPTSPSRSRIVRQYPLRESPG